MQDLVNKDVGGFFTSYMANYITEFNGIVQIMTDPYPCYQCTNFYFPVEDQGNTVYFNVLVNYSYINGLDLEKRQDVFEVTFYRDGINLPWIGFAKESAKRSNTNTKVLEKRTLSKEEQNYWTCNTLSVRTRKENAVSYFNSLPKVDIPKFTKAQDMIWWLHQFLRKAKPGEVEYVFLSKLQPAYFLECGSYILTANGANLIQTIKEIVSRPKGNYGDHYCDIPEIKHQQGNDNDYMVQYYPKWGQTFSRIQVQNFNGEFKISDIQLSVYSKKEDIDAVMKVPASQCKENIVASWKNYSLNEYKISALFPAEPKTQSYPDKPNKKGLVLQFDKVEWAITAEKLTSSQLATFKEPLKMHTYAKQLSQYTRDKYEATPGSDRTWQYKGVKGYESNWTVTKDRNYLDMKYRAIIIKDIFYEIWILGPYQQNDLNKFLESVTIN